MLLLEGAASAAEPVRFGELQRDTLKGVAAGIMASIAYSYLALTLASPDPSFALTTVPYFLVKYFLSGAFVGSVTFLGSLSVLPTLGLRPLPHKHTWQELQRIEWPNEWVVTKHGRHTEVTRPNEYYAKCSCCACRRWVSWRTLHGPEPIDYWQDI